MLKDITIGQFFPGDSAVHRLDPRVKIVLTVAFIVLLFLAERPGFLCAHARLSGYHHRHFAHFAQAGRART